VILRNLSLKGVGPGTNGINVLAAGTVVVDHASITGFAGRGISVTTDATAKVVVTDTTITNCGTGIFLAATSGQAQVIMSNTRLTNNTNGFEAATNGRAILDNSIISGNSGSEILASA